MRKNIFIFCIIVLAVGILSSCRQSTTSKHTTNVEEHKIVLVDSGIGAIMGHYDMPSGSTGFKYDSGNCKVRLENEVLIVNGKKYVIPNKNDSIRIEDGRVQINGMAVEPKNE